MPDRTMGEDLVGSAAAWHDAFVRRHGRALRVLHIGNIANNAYNNAKIQRLRGVEADVLCFDMHAMSCPEWEDADFTGDIGNLFLPDWWSVDLRGFRRPDWFFNGLPRLAIASLRARLEGRSRSATFARLGADAYRWHLCSRSLPAALSRRAARAGEQALRAAWRGARRSWRRGRGGGEPRAEGRARWGAAVCDRFAALFPDRPDQLQLDDLNMAYRDLHLWGPVLRHYDVVQGYSTDGIWPYLCGLPYVAYEHGTLRSIPFEATPQGRLCALTYKEASAALVTNLDCLPAAERLGLDRHRVVCLPHAFNDAKVRAFASEHPGLSPSVDGPVTFFAPARQHWIGEDPNYAKGNDRMLRALTLLPRSGRPWKVVCVAWGRDLDASRRLAAELGCADRVEWVQPMSKRELWMRYLQSHAVLDQFLLPSIGGVTFEAMALGRRVLTALDVPLAREFFGEAPPLLVASRPDEIATAMARVLDDPQDAVGIGDGTAEWVSSYHSADRTVAIQLAAYRRILDADHRKDG